MRKIIIIIPIVLIVVLCALLFFPSYEGYVYGRIRVPAADIYAEVFTVSNGPNCGCVSSLWNGGKAIAKADLTGLMIGDMVDLRSLEGEHLVLECIGISRLPMQLLRANGDVLIDDGNLVYRFIRL